ncbi:hypothetical protein F4821DRAFT_223415 [Hypoxylon rubiginosum]|uniref:Uncharacterized protein n=1 Tax=Hypoxylon rubiginosum TaxID=110542 RepID=A0ACC0DJB7_9PEZI|nr:hypothetical protein F4821DRAFT_223415 [Hypoxylon rubiginosum]
MDGELYEYYRGVARGLSDSDDVIRPLGLLNGRYFIRALSILSPREDLSASLLWLVLTLRGTELWGKFDFGVITGHLYIEERPWRASSKDLKFNWRGRHVDGRQFRGDDNVGCIIFSGNESIGGMLFYGQNSEDGINGIGFSGTRISGQVTRSEIPAGEMVRAYDELS